LSIDDDQDAPAGDDARTELGKPPSAAATWGTAGLLLVYVGLGSYCLASGLSGLGAGHPPRVTHSAASALSNLAPGSRSGATARTDAPASGSASFWSQIWGAKAASAKAGAVSQAVAAPNEALMAISATAIGSNGPSDGDHPELASLVLDHQASLSWKTHWYATANFGSLKDGTGLLLDMGRTVTIRQIQLSLSGSPGSWGADLQIRVGASPVLTGLAPVAQANDAGGQLTARLRSAGTGRYVQIWFTKLPLDQQGTFQEHVYGVTVHGSVPGPASSPAGRAGARTTSQATRDHGRAAVPLSCGFAGGFGRFGHAGADGLPGPAANSLTDSAVAGVGCR
jgi:hypothetical protein